eukprot:15366130-Alexandrium_andersonii.AAC.1
MSASLVGSEMCIRDRRPSLAKRHRSSYWAVVSESRPLKRRSHLHDRQPVSYTHLTLPTICSV